MLESVGAPMNFVLREPWRGSFQGTVGLLTDSIQFRRRTHTFLHRSSDSLGKTDLGLVEWLCYASQRKT